MTTPAAPVAATGGKITFNWKAVAVFCIIALAGAWVVSKFTTQELYDNNGVKTGEIKTRFGMPKWNKKAA